MTIWAVDLETTGLKPWDGTILGIGVAASSKFADTKYYTGPAMAGIMRYMHEKGIQVIGHNILFDKGWLDYHFPQYPLKWVCDTGVLSQMYDNSDFVHGFGLKDSAQRLLGVEAHEEELQNWVLENVEGAKKSNYRAFMQRVPVEIVSKYCRYDALYTLRLYDLLSNQISGWEVYMSLFLDEVDATIQQQRYGIRVNSDGFERLLEQLETENVAIENEFLTHPEIAPHIEIAQRRKFQKSLDDKLAKSKTGKIRPVEFETWQEKNPFNPNSDAQLIEVFNSQGLFYNPVTKIFEYPFLTPGKKPSLSKDFIGLYGVGGKILAKQGELSSMITHTKHVIEETTAYERVHPDINLIGSRSGRITASGMNILAVPFEEKDYANNFLADEDCVFFTQDVAALEPTVTANLSGDKRLRITCTPLEAPPTLDADGFLCVDDLYLLVGSGTSFAGEQIKAVIEPLQWFQDQGDSAKKMLKDIRFTLKSICLAVNYGAGAKKIQMTIFKQTKRWIPLIQIEETLQMYYRAFPRVRAYGTKLASMAQREGQFINPFGFPLTFTTRDLTQDEDGEVVPKFYKALNRMIQSTAQGCMKLIISALWKRLRHEDPYKIRFTIANYHDAYFLHVHESMMDTCRAIADESLQEVNETLANIGWDIPLRMTSAFGRTMYAAKTG